MKNARLPIFQAALLALLPGLLFAAQKSSTVLVVLPASEQSAAPVLAQHREELKERGFRLEIRRGSHPLVTIMDPAGAVTARYAGDSPEAFLIQRLNLPTNLAHSVLRGKRLEAVLSADYRPASGHVVLALDLQLKAGVHVYAPGVEGYIPIAWKIQTLPGIETREIVFPKPETLHLPAIDETVPAYQGHFRLTREIVLPPDAAKSLSIRGTLRYQACDDTMCYVPESLPLHWDLRPSASGS